MLARTFGEDVGANSGGSVELLATESETDLFGRLSTFLNFANVASSREKLTMPLPFSAGASPNRETASDIC